MLKGKRKCSNFLIRSFPFFLYRMTNHNWTYLTEKRPIKNLKDHVVRKDAGIVTKALNIGQRTYYMCYTELRNHNRIVYLEMSSWAALTWYIGMNTAV